MEINNIKTNLEKNGMHKKSSLFKNQLLIVLMALGISWYATEKILSSQEDQDFTVEVPTSNSSVAHTATFSPEKWDIKYNKDSINYIIESRIADIQKQREQEFLQVKLMGYQREVKAALNTFQNDNTFQKTKQEALSDKQLTIYDKNIWSAENLSSLWTVCEDIVSYITKLLNKQDVEIEWKTLKTKNIKNSDFFVKLNEQKHIFQNFATIIKSTRFEPEVFKNLKPSVDVVKYSSAIDSLKNLITINQDSLIGIQDSLVTLYKTLNDSTDQKIEIELALKSGKVDYIEFDNTTIISDTASLNKKHDIEQRENEQKNHVVVIEASILDQNKNIINLEDHQAPALSSNIDNLYKEYEKNLTLLIDAIRDQHTNIMTEKDKWISDQIWSFKKLIKDIYVKIDTLKNKHKAVLNSIIAEKEKIHLSDSSKLEGLLIKFQAEESHLAHVYSQTNTELINKNISLWNMLLENYDIYLDMLKKCKEPLNGYVSGLEKDISILETNITELQRKYDENQIKIKEFSKSDDTKDVNECQKKIQESMMYSKKMNTAKKEKTEKSTTKENIQKEIVEINNVQQYVDNNRNLTVFGMKIYLVAKQIQSTEAQFNAAKETKNHYEFILWEKNKSFDGITTALTEANINIQKITIDTISNKDNYIVLATLMEQKDSLLLNKKALESDITNLKGKIDAKEREINKLSKMITDFGMFGSDELKKRDGLIYNRNQSFSKQSDKTKYYKKDIIRSPEEILEDVSSIIKTIKNVK